jgi:hypothetical protein
MVKKLLKILNICLVKGTAVDNYERAITAPVQTAGAFENNFIIKMILAEILAYNLHRFPVSS